MTDLFSVICVLSYVMFLTWCLYGWRKTLQPVQAFSGLTKVSVVVAVRNESDKIENLLNSLMGQTYSSKLIEYIFVDDQSNDGTAEKIELFFEGKNVNFKCWRSDGSGKKDALSKGIRGAWNELIITTDADCLVPPQWISAIVGFYERSGAVLIAMPVYIKTAGGFLERMQKLEIAGLCGIAAGSLANGKPMICNGANLAFSRTKWLEVMDNNYSSYASGDDTDLLYALNEKYPERTKYYSNSAVAVETEAVKGPFRFFLQRQRWASKITGTMSGFTIWIALIAWLTHAILLYQLFDWVFGDGRNLFLLAALVKAMVESILINAVLKLKGEGKADHLVIGSQVFYWIYITLAGPAGLFFKYSWKGRSVSK